MLVIFSNKQRSVSESYCFTLKDIEMIFKLDIQATDIESGLLKTDGEVKMLLKFGDLFRRMKQLSFEDFEKGTPPLEMDRYTN